MNETLKQEILAVGQEVEIKLTELSLLKDQFLEFSKRPNIQELKKDEDIIALDNRIQVLMEKLLS